ncbi:MAG: hypothetical protein IJK56_00785 [Firmicutes bacterium]|nr:hypothetical protein [Bacillota bacterium]
MKKITMICMAMILLLSAVLSGCSGKTEDKEAEGNSTAEEISKSDESGKPDNIFDYAFAVEENALASRTVAFGTSSEDTLTQLELPAEAMLNDTTLGIRRITRTVEGEGYMKGMTEVYNYAGNKLNSAAYVIVVAPDQLETLVLQIAGLFGEKLPADWTTSDTTKFMRRYSWKDTAGTRLDILVPKNPNKDGMNEINISITLDQAK